MSYKPRYKTLLQILLLVTFSLPLVAEEATTMPNSEFLDGFRYEYANRAFALQLTKRFAKSTDGKPAHQFWQAFHELEAFSAPRYTAAAEKLGVAPPKAWWINTRARMMSWLPMSVFEWGLKRLITKTEAKYIPKLKQVQALGPEELQEFLAYMVEQEITQVEMTKLAFAGDYEAAALMGVQFIDNNK